MEKNICRVLTCAFLLIIVFNLNSAAQTVTTKISGGWIKGIEEGPTLVFKGIPYAKAPVGPLRFMPPQPAAPWKDTLSCQKFGSMAAQGGAELKGSEDCLSLNVYTPTTDKNAKLPVLVWVHGGALTGGSGMGMNGHAFADDDSVVTVTINYRLGVFGFMYLGDVNNAYKTSANNGLLDLIMALKWIRQNIAALGGDASRVTVMGESAGAKLSSALLATPLAKGYYSQQVLESGGVQCIRDSVTTKGIRQRLMTELGVSKPADLLKISTEKLIAAQSKIANGAQGTNYWGPVSDGVVIDGDAYQAVRKLNNSKVRFIIGTNKFESKMFIAGDKRLNQPDSTVLYGWFGNNYRYVLDAYQTEAKKTSADSAALKVLTQYMYQMHSYRLANTLAQAGNHVWLYRFDYKRDGTGATHADELAYLWFNPRQNNFNDTEKQLAAQMHQNWVNFIKGKTPGEVSGKTWPHFVAGENSIVVFDAVSGPVQLSNVYNDKASPSACFVLK
ncbi:carboxylesterase/lipase family protein [Mucilaginibacter celer]|uniref:Carboxylesterase/lipase family protein n=1 Tax=Mucilaginibacter celer TaxID=2305508 RepID=A0A494VQI5_9SPHI|nr:carboxylesterase family protein [Mucilaginibacter celer]AYL97826.1 carboxylesterase/lipase family protein [Mucilaginibacter celer]